jgi:hypothetical protein
VHYSFLKPSLTSIFHAAGSVRTEPVLAGLWG